jgi:soluble lytic murein transglycosylase-like protein
LDHFVNRNTQILLLAGLGILLFAGGRAVAVRVFSYAKGEKYRALFDAVESKYRIPHGLLFRLAYQESRFRDDIISGALRSSAGAVGMMQIVPKYHPDIGEAGALDVPRAIDYAGKYLSSLHNQFGSWALALAAYNAGPGNVIKHGGIPPFTETQNYVAQILRDNPVTYA